MDGSIELFLVSTSVPRLLYIIKYTVWHSCILHQYRKNAAAQVRGGGVCPRCPETPPPPPPPIKFEGCPFYFGFLDCFRFYKIIIHNAYLGPTPPPHSSEKVDPPQHTMVSKTFIIFRNEQTKCSAGEETRCHHMGYSFRLAARVLLCTTSYGDDRIYHVIFVTPAMGPPRGIDPTTYSCISIVRYYV